MKAELLQVRDLEPADAAWIAAHLCNPGSEMQTEFYERRTDTPVVVFSNEVPIAWVVARDWRGDQSIEAYTDPEWRRRGLARAGVIMLLATSFLVRSEPVAVFNRDCVQLAASLRFSQTLLYQRDGKGWRLIFG